MPAEPAKHLDSAVAPALLALAAAMLSTYVGAAIAKHLFPLVGSQGVTALRVGLAACVLLAWRKPWRTPLAGATFPTSWFMA